jgi:esterase/lipase
MKKIFVFSGLGADERVFVHLKIEGYQLIHVKWLKPIKSESLQDYAKRISAFVTDENLILMGLSFGGIVANEVSKIKPIEKLILLSTVKTKNEFPFYIRLVKAFQLHKMIPYSILRHFRILNNYVFSAQSREQKEMLRKIIDESDVDTIQWSIDKVVNWQNEIPPPKYLHLHGTKDIIFDCRKIKNAHFINGGGHLMVLSRANDISKLIADFLKQ